MRVVTVIGLVTTTLVATALGAPPAKSGQKDATRNVQQLTYANVVAHFKEAGMRKTEVQKRCTIFFEGEWKSKDVYNYGLIIVENSDEDVQVTFYLTDAHEMNWVTEFLDAPFFAAKETQKLFGLISAHPDNRTEKVGRYHVDFHHWRPRHADIFVFSLTLLKR